MESMIMGTSIIASLFWRGYHVWKAKNLSPTAELKARYASAVEAHFKGKSDASDHHA